MIMHAALSRKEMDVILQGLETLLDGSTTRAVEDESRKLFRKLEHFMEKYSVDANTTVGLVRLNKTSKVRKFNKALAKTNATYGKALRNLAK